MIMTMERVSTTRRVIGLGMLVHVVLLCVLKLSRGIEGEMLWISHVALALAGVGMMIGSAKLLGTSFVSIAFLHSLWLIDACVGLVTGRFPLGLTGYIVESDWMTLLGTSHHVYLLPALVVVLLRERSPAIESWVSSVVLFGALVVVCRIALPVSMNVNFAHAVFPGSDLGAFRWFNGLPFVGYLAVHLGVVAAGFFAPAAVLLRWFAGVPRTREVIPVGEMS